MNVRQWPGMFLIMVGIAALGFLLALTMIEVTRATIGVQLAQHEECDPYYDDCGGDYQGGPSGGRYEGGRSGDTDQRGNENCRNACGNTIIVPSPGRDRDGERSPRATVPV